MALLVTLLCLSRKNGAAGYPVSGSRQYIQQCYNKYAQGTFFFIILMFLNKRNIKLAGVLYTW